MPTYEYACQKCGHQFEIFQSMKDAPLTACPQKKCKGRLKKLLGSGAGLIFKGSGFYITDYRSENYKAGAKKDSTSSESKSSGGETKSTPAKSETKSSTAKKDK